MRDGHSNLESFKCRNFNANEALGGGAVGRKDVLNVVEIEIDLSFLAKEIGQVLILSLGAVEGFTKFILVSLLGAEGASMFVD